MSTFETIAKFVGSRRYARDLIECGGTLRTRPWWDGVLNTWDTQQQDLLHDARVAHGYPRRGLAALFHSEGSNPDA